MKRGEAAIYKSIEPQQPPYYHQPNMDFRGMYNQRYKSYITFITLICMCTLGSGRDTNLPLFSIRQHF